jgi:hypothetical protein
MMYFTAKPWLIFASLPGQGTIVKEQFVGSYVGKTIADLVADAEAAALYINLHNRLNPSVSFMCSSTMSSCQFCAVGPCMTLDTFSMSLLALSSYWSNHAAFWRWLD